VVQPAQLICLLLHQTCRLLLQLAGSALQLLAPHVGSSQLQLQTLQIHIFFHQLLCRLLLRTLPLLG
jgi:hypothetical protein